MMTTLTTVDGLKSGALFTIDLDFRGRPLNAAEWLKVKSVEPTNEVCTTIRIGGTESYRYVHEVQLFGGETVRLAADMRVRCSI